MYVKKEVKCTYFINQSMELLVLASYMYVMIEFITDAELEAIIFAELLAKSVLHCKKEQDLYVVEMNHSSYLLI